jgi:hypothetical protein
MALTGFIDGNVCYVDWWSAYLGHFRSINSVILSNGNTVYYNQNPATGLFEQLTQTPTGVVTAVVVPSPVFSQCDPTAGFTDGMAFSMVVVGLVFSASIWGIISKAK